MTPKPPHGSKSAFVRAQPTTTPAKKVVALARKEGLKLSVAQVYNIRALFKKLGGIRLDWGHAPRVVAHRGRSAGKTSETQLRRLFAELGLVRSREIVTEVAGRFARG